ncbi:hypothetical protein Tco_1501867 [Tanacetum coccineum]
MPPKRFKKKSIRKIVEKRVAEAIEEYEKTRADSTILVDLDQQILEGLLHQRCMDVRIRHLRTANLTLSTGLKEMTIDVIQQSLPRLVLMCPELVSTEKKKIEKYIRGFPRESKEMLLLQSLGKIPTRNNISPSAKPKTKAAKDYWQSPAKGRGTLGNLPGCNSCKAHHQVQVLVLQGVVIVTSLVTQEGECRTRIPVAGGQFATKSDMLWFG